MKQGQVNMDWNETFQKIDGFGFSEAFHKAGSLYRIDEPLRSQLLDFLFDPIKGAGVSILRNTIGDGGHNASGWGNDYDGSAESIQPEIDGGFVWERPDWETLKETFDFHQIWLTREAKKRGLRTVIATCWSPPYWMKSNGSVMGEPKARLLPEYYQAFADYLAQYVIGYKREFDIEIEYISPANEPDQVVAYPGCIWQPSEMVEFISRYLGPTFERLGVTAKIYTPEYVRWTENAAIREILATDAEKYVSDIASHAYEMTDLTLDPMALAKEKNKTIWMTEFGELSTTGFLVNTIPNGLYTARLIQEMMTVPGVSAWLYWWGIANNGADGSDLIRLMNTTSDQSVKPTENGTFRVFKRFYAYANFSHFIRPGYARIGADKHPAEDVTLTAYRDTASDGFAIVAVNEAEETVTLTLNMTNFPQLTEIAPYITSDKENLRLGKSYPVIDDVSTVILPPQSIVTFAPPNCNPLDLVLKLKDVFSAYLAVEADAIENGQIDGDSVVLQAGGYLMLDSLNFADGSASGLLDEQRKLTMVIELYSETGGEIEVRLDAPDLYLVGGIMIPPGLAKREIKFPIATCTKEEMLQGGAKDKAYGIRQTYICAKGTPDKTLFGISAIRFEV